MPAEASPYSRLSPEAFWRTAVAEANSSDLKGLYRKKFSITPADQIATAGSCFAQHIGRHLRGRGFAVIDAEPAPAGLARDQHDRFGYSIYSARYGNIYSVRQMLQLAKEAYGEWVPSQTAWAGEHSRYFDALRPGVEPTGLSSADEVSAHRREHLTKVAGVLSSMDVFIFTMGLTEAWIDRKSGTVFPTAPGTIAGSYDPHIYEFYNFKFQEIYADFVELMGLLENHRKTEHHLRYILTVSPVPLTATASGHHVLAATIYSKSVLRAVAGQLSEEFDQVDYFPSFEIVCNPWSRTRLYEDNMRSVHPDGVATVMRAFFSEHMSSAPLDADQEEQKPQFVDRQPGQSNDGSNVICEEELLNAFAKVKI